MASFSAHRLSPHHPNHPQTDMSSGTILLFLPIKQEPRSHSNNSPISAAKQQSGDILSMFQVMLNTSLSSLVLRSPTTMCSTENTRVFMTTMHNMDGYVKGISQISNMISVNLTDRHL